VRYPYERFLKHLLIQGRDFDEIRETIDACGFVCDEDSLEEDLGYLRGQVEEHARVVECQGGDDELTSEELMEVLETEVEISDDMMMNQAAIVKSGPLRRAIEAMLIKSLPLERVKAEVDARFGMSVDPEILQYYHDFYWDSESMNFADWFTYIEIMQRKDSEFFKEIIMADMNRAIFLAGGTPEMGEIDFLRIWLQKAQMMLMEAVDPVINPARIAPKDWVACYSHMREHYLDAEERSKSEDQAGAVDRLKEVVKLEDPRRPMLTMGEIEEAGGSLG